MRVTRVAAFAALFGSIVSAQTPARNVSNNGALEADLHYATGTDTWVSTNKPAYVALFVVSQNSISQLYPTFSAQAEYPIGKEHRLVSIGQGGLYSPSAGFFGGSGSPFSFTGGGSRVGSWPQTLLLVASTSPLRVSSPWTTNLDLNHKLIQRGLIDLQTDAGIETIIDMIRPLDPDAEIAYDRTDGIQARAAQYFADDGFNIRNRAGVVPTYNCLISGPYDVPSNGLWTPVCAIPYPAPPTKPITPPKDTATGTSPVTKADVNRRVASDKRVITDPDEIRRFIESQTGRRADGDGTSRIAGSNGEKIHAGDSQNSQNSANAPAPDKSTANVDRRQHEGTDAKNNPRPTNTDHPSIKQQDRPAPAPRREESPRVSAPPPAPAPAPAPTPAAPIIKP